MVMRGRGVRAAVGAVVLGVLVGGCTGEAEPAETTAAGTPEASESVTPTPSATPTVDPAAPPQQPAEMAEVSAAGAAAAAQYFLALYPYIYATGDTTTWRGMSAETCDFCLESAADAEQLVASGKRGGSPLEVVSADGKELKEDVWFSAQVRVVQPPTVETDEAGEQTQTSEGGTYDFDFALTWSDRWVIDSVGIEPASAE